jgi:hypothetical protein
MRVTKSIGGMAVMVLALAALVAMVAPVASADEVVTLTTSTCGSSTCPLATYTVTVHQTGSDTYTVSLDVLIDSGATIISGTDDHITSAAVKFDTNLTSATLDTTSLNVGSLSDWTTSVNSTINNADCSTNGGGGFVCSVDSGSGLAITQGGDYKWVWDVTTSGNLTDAITIKVNYDPHNGYIISQDVAVPEPGTLALLSMGLLGLMFVRRRLVA